MSVARTDFDLDIQIHTRLAVKTDPRALGRRRGDLDVALESKNN
jgi:hypothetical protein